MLLVRVIVTLIRGGCLCRAEAERVYRELLIYFCVQQIWIALEQSRRQAIHAGSSRARLKRRLMRRVQRIGIGREVVIERDVFVKDHDQVFDWGCGLRRSLAEQRTYENDRSREGRFLHALSSKQSLGLRPIFFVPRTLGR